MRFWPLTSVSDLDKINHKIGAAIGMAVAYLVEMDRLVMAMKRGRHAKRWIGAATLLLVSWCRASSDDRPFKAKPVAVDADRYTDFMAHEALDVQDLAEGAEIQRRAFSRMTPPGLSWVQPMFPLTLPFDSTNYDEKFLDALLGEDRNSVAVYPLTLALDSKTRETWIYNAEGKPIATLPSEKTSRAWPEGSDPARVVLRLDLLPAEDVEPYLYAEDRIAATVAAFPEKAAKSARKEAVAKSSLTGGQFGFADARKLTNGNFRLTVTNGTAAAEIYSFTVWHTSSTVVSTWTNDLDEVVVSTNVVWMPVSPPYDGLESAWEVETTNLLLTNGVGVWEDASATSAARVRFYGATQRADSDEDGLTDGAEIFLHRTDPSLSDTDGDGMSDGWEVSYGLNARSGLDASLVGWWKLDDGAGSNAVNSAQDAYHGELVGFSGLGGGWTDDGFLGGALHFDGIDDWVRIAQDPALLTGGPFTVSAQVWLDLDCASAWPEAVSDYEAGTWNGYCLGFNENRAYAMMGPYGWLMDSNALTGRWVWTALEYDGAQMRLYLDGVLAGATSAVFAPATNGFLAIGNGQDDSYGSEFWKGRIDDVRLYRTALGTNGLAGMYDAQEDPDGDGLSNLEECGIGSDIHGSNEVVFVYFVDSTNQSPGGRRSVGGGETAQFVTWDALQAKAASTVRFKEGFAEFTNSTLPPSNPPKWYLGTIYYSEGLGTVTDIDDDYSRIISYDYWGYCRKEYSPSGWPDTITNHICEGYGHTIEDWTGEYCYGYTTRDYSFSQPDENVAEVQCGHGVCTYGTSDYCTNLYASSCIMVLMGGGYAYPFEMWEEYISNSDWSYSVEDNGSYEILGGILTNEYTDGLLLSYTAGDLGGMADWDGLNWGQRWARDEHRQTPYAETLPTNELYSIHLMATNRASLQLQKLRYRWSLPSVSGVVYRVFWWEKFIPANGGSGTSVVQRTADVLGTGGTVYTPAFDLPPPSAEGCTYPVPMETVLKVDTIEASAPVADNSPRLFEGNKTDFGDPCATNDPGQALVVFHVDARDANFVVRDFDVTLKANVLPASITADQLDESWAKVEGPASGSLNRTDSFEVKYQNPKVGGLYQFEFGLGLNGCANNGANLLLPLGGPDVTTYFNSEVARYDQWMATLKTRLDSYSAIVRWYRLRTCSYRTVNDMDYKEDSWQEGDSPCMKYANGTVTLYGFVLGADQLGNLLYAYTFARAEFYFSTAWLGGNAAQLWSTRDLDSSDDQAAYTAGYAFGDNGGVFSDYLSPSGVPAYDVSPVEDMQTETAKRAWPSQEPLPQAQWRTYPVSLPPP